MTSHFVTLDKRGSVAILTLNSPATRNTLSSKNQYSAIENACRDIQLDKEIRAVVLTGAGKAFCAGAISRICKLALKAVAFRQSTIATLTRKAFVGSRLPCIILRCRRSRLSTGLRSARASTLLVCAICASRANLQMLPRVLSRLVSYQDGGAWLLQRIAGIPKAAKMTFTGDALSADEALACGFVSKVVKPETLLDETLKLAGRVAVNPGHALRMAKRLIREAQVSRLETVLEMSAAFQALAHATDEHRAIVGAAVAKLSKAK